MSLQFTKSASLLAEAGCKLGNKLFYYWPLLRNNNMATNLRRCTISHGGRRFASCNPVLPTGQGPDKGAGGAMSRGGLFGKKKE